ncbi:MAG: hypothetical protein JNM09_05135 [Blastocatellia bacterium]|nr:hypothetical protein [Blastocatellia bacterium]
MALIEEDRGRPTGSNRETGRRDPTHRTTTPALVEQLVTITNDNGNITVEPMERDLYDGEQIKWICQELAWEVRFDQVGSTTPFEGDVFGPGLIPLPVKPESSLDFPVEEILEEISGPVRDDASEGLYAYSIQVGEFGPLQARVKFIRGPRPR